MDIIITIFNFRFEAIHKRVLQNLLVKVRDAGFSWSRNTNYFYNICADNHPLLLPHALFFLGGEGIGDSGEGSAIFSKLLLFQQ